MHSEFFNAPGPTGTAGTAGSVGSVDSAGSVGSSNVSGAPGTSATTAAAGMPHAPSYLGSAATGSHKPDATAQHSSPHAGQTEQSPGQDDAQRQFEQRLHQHEAARREQWQGQVSQWRQEVAQDPHLGGNNMAASVARAQLALDRFDQNKHIGRLLEESGYGNHPEVLRFFNRMADSLMEDSLVRGEPGASMPPLEERMYAGWSSKR